MALNYIWIGFFIAAFISCIFQALLKDNSAIFAQVVQATFDMASLSVEIALGLVGVLCLWLGFFTIAERAGFVELLTKVFRPLFKQLMPEVPSNHPAIGSVTMNMAANMLGLDNAATPLGLKAMQDLQELNPNKDTASNAQILFLVLNTSSVTLLPVTIFLFRAQQGSMDPTAVFIPILLATCASTIAGLLLVSIIQGLNLFNKTVFLYVLGFTALIGLLLGFLLASDADQLAERSSLLGNLLLLLIIITFLVMGFARKINVYDAFIDGAKQGFDVALKIIPYLVAMLVAIGVLRASLVLDAILNTIEKLVVIIGLNPDFISALPTALMRPFSGSGARAMMLETMNTYGVDSFAANVAAIVQGSTETTFYVLAVYFGSVGIQRVRHAIGCGLFADFVGITAAIFLGYWFFT
ncbi:MAG: nucleoside recognition domain-containing protein [Gammaproteobacteria bacterium]